MPGSAFFFKRIHAFLSIEKLDEFMNNIGITQPFSSKPFLIMCNCVFIG